MGTVVFFLNSAQSHYNSSYHLSRVLSNLGHRIIYLGYKFQNNDKVTLRQGFEFVDLGSYTHSVRKERGYVSRWLLGATNEEIKERRDLFSSLIEKFNPKIVIVSRDMAAYILMSRDFTGKLYTFNTQVSWNEHNFNPPMFSGFLPKDDLLSRIYTAIMWCGFYTSQLLMSRYRLQLFDISIQASRFNMIRLAKVLRFPLREMNFRGFFLGFKLIPELMAGCKAFEYPWLSLGNQKFIGPMVLENRIDINIDPRFKKALKELISRRKDGKKLIYCAVGTLSQYEIKKTKIFIEKIIAAFRDRSEYDIIIATGDIVQLTIDQLPTNVHLFSHVGQLEMLKHSDLMITHAGMNSVNECILMEVPMLAYPFAFDQYGNAARILFHRLGLRGNITTDAPSDIMAKADYIIQRQFFKVNIGKIKRECQKASSVFEDVALCVDK